MKLEQQVVSLELAKKLKELGVKQESLFIYAGELLVFKTDVGCYAQSGAGINDKYLNEHQLVSAFTVAELGEIIKGGQSLKQLQHHADVAARGNYLFDADYWAAVVIYLLENKLI